MLARNNNFEATHILINRMISENPIDGVNYFNRAVLAYLTKGKSPLYDIFDINVIKDCKKAQECGYTNPELYYLLFLEFFAYNPEGKSRQMANEVGKIYNFSEYGIDFHVKRALLDSAIDSSLSNSEREKYIFARFKLCDINEIATLLYDTHKDGLPLFKRDCETVLNDLPPKNRSVVN